MYLLSLKLCFLYLIVLIALHYPDLTFRVTAKNTFKLHFGLCIILRVPNEMGDHQVNYQDLLILDVLR